jgi:hypothetical protein
MSPAEQRVAAARRALDAARDAREANQSTDTANAVAIARQHFEDARRALVREEWV